MDVILFSTDEQVSDAALISFESHVSMRRSFPWLPPHTIDEYRGLIGWMMRNGGIRGIYDGSRLSAFLGCLKIDDFRNAGPGSFTPDWCLGIAPDGDPVQLLRTLIRETLADLVAQELPIHAVGIHADRPGWREIFELSGYGRIVLDAARSRDDLQRELETLPGTTRSVTVRRASREDAAVLAGFDVELAAHIGASPVLMPSTHGRSSSEWEEWFDEPEAVAFIAVSDGTPAGFIKAQRPQFDVSFTVHGDSTLAINGLFVDSRYRCRGISRSLLSSIVLEAAAMEKTVISVDCETLNPEAYGFWTRFFTPVSWSLERRY